MNNTKLYRSLSDNERSLKIEFAGCSDIIFRRFKAGSLFKRDCLAIYVDGFCDKNLISQQLLTRLMNDTYLIGMRIKKKADAKLISNEIPISEIGFGNTFAMLCECILDGDCAVMIDGMDEYVKIAARKPPARGIEESNIRAVIRGPKDSFNENLRTNTALLRSKLKNTSMKIVSLTCGDISNTDIAVCYIDNVADKNLVSSVKAKIKSTNIKSVMDSGILQNSIDDQGKNFLPRTEVTDRPDEACSAMIQGRIVVLCDNSPCAMIIPGLLISMMSAPDDDFNSNKKRSVFFLLRLSALIITLILPAAYIAIVEFNPEFVSDKMILFVINARRHVPFPAFIEIVFMEFLFEIIIEAGIRLPKQIGFSVGLVGTIVIGESIVKANLVSIVGIIIVALTAILVFVIPSYSFAVTVRLHKFIFMSAAAIAGFFGITIAFLVSLITLCDINQYGIEFMYPFVDSNSKLKSKIKKGYIHEN